MRDTPASSAALRQAMGRLTVATQGRGFTDVTRNVARWLAGAHAGDGLLTLFIRHTSASLVIQENADPDVLVDLAAALDRLAPRGAVYVHDAEGPDDMPAHIRTMLTGTSLAVPVAAGHMTLGTWQGLYVAEHRGRPHRREIVLVFQGTLSPTS